ncbi:MAG: Flp pilus assembly protein CpaB [Candidatus Melainabacteria bacterium RIFCSPLOWO2_02_FULL_35_15]|nr:MAG: Flp pilus assembly protein CpaB [Candidatus Melainabacteria bacterium RIFCSPLOWO2_12_FULL_35_11]OGI14663.1 MAG: Flp pilus assembly protein CpaB [Candidatus Melainabacteria bacterium RIFCSPLOWO2_02_FULL_35_15]
MAVNPTSFTPKTKNKVNSLVVMIVIAVVLGLIAAIGIWQYLNKTQQKVKELTVTKAVVVASKQIPAGKKIEESDLAIKQLPAQAVPKDYPSSIDSLKGRLVKGTISTGEVITEGRLVGEGAAGGLPVVIPAGYRAITIRVNEVVGVGGFISPGDHVDILSILKKSEDQTFSKTILQNVLVLAVGDKIFDPNIFSDPQAKVVSQVTFALSPKDTEKLALASETGQLHLVLRPHSEKELAITPGASLEDVYGYIVSGAGNQPINIPIAAGGSNADKNAIEIILGDQRTYYYY